MEVSHHWGVLLLVAALAGEAAANGRELMGFTIAKVPDPMDAKIAGLAMQATTAAPWAVTTAAFGFNMDSSSQAAMLKQHIQAIGSQTLPPFQNFGQILGRSWASILVLMAMVVGVAVFLGWASFLAYQRGLYGQVPESEKRFNISLGLVAGLALAGGILILCFGMTQQAEPVFKQMQDLQFATGGLIAGAWNAVVHPPPVTTTLSPAKMRIATAAMKQASDAMKQVREVKAELHKALEALAAERLKAQQAPPVEGSAEQPPPAAPVPSSEVSSLQLRLAALRHTAKAKAAQALPSVPTAAPTLEDGYGSGYGATGNAAGSGYGAATAAAAPAAMSPCGTTTPAAVAAPAVPAPPQVVNYMPPLGCNCKVAVGAGLSYVGHCWTYDTLYQNQPVCVLEDPTCGGVTQDAGLATGDVVVTCMVAEQGGGIPYHVSLDRSTSTIHLGIDIAPDASLKNLIITKVSGGLVEIWNSAHPEALIKPGDLITTVNGQAGSSITLTQQCVIKQMLEIRILRQNGWPIRLDSSAPAAPVVDANAFKSGDCSRDGNGWGDVSICLSNAAPFPAGSSLWHCPWESMMLMSTKAFGGCNAIKIDCTGTNFLAVMSLYQKHDNNKTHPPEGSLGTVEYARKCVMHQCQNGADPGAGIWTAGVSVSPWVGVANPCGKAGCERLYSQSRLIEAFGSAALAIPASLVIAISIVGFALLLLRAHRAAYHQSATHSHTLLLSVEGVNDEIDQEAPVHADENIE